MKVVGHGTAGCGSLGEAMCRPARALVTVLSLVTGFPSTGSAQQVPDWKTWVEARRLAAKVAGGDDREFIATFRELIAHPEVVTDFEALQGQLRVDLADPVLDDEVYRTAREKYRAIIDLIKDCRRRGQHVLVGTTGNTLVQVTSTPPIPGAGLKLGEWWYAVSTTAVYSGFVHISTVYGSALAGRGPALSGRPRPEESEAASATDMGTERWETMAAASRPASQPCELRPGAPAPAAVPAMTPASTSATPVMVPRARRWLSASRCSICCKRTQAGSSGSRSFRVWSRPP